MHGEQRARGFVVVGLRRFLVKRFAQCIGVALSHHRGQPLQLLLGFQHGVVLAGRAGLVQARLQGHARGLRNAVHQRPGLCQNVVDDALEGRGGAAGGRGRGRRCGVFQGDLLGGRETGVCLTLFVQCYAAKRGQRPLVFMDARPVRPGVRTARLPYPPWNLTTSGTMSSATMLMILINGLMAGPAVSL